MGIILGFSVYIIYSFKYNNIIYSFLFCNVSFQFVGSATYFIPHHVNLTISHNNFFSLTFFFNPISLPGMSGRMLTLRCTRMRVNQLKRERVKQQRNNFSQTHSSSFHCISNLQYKMSVCICLLSRIAFHCIPNLQYKDECLYLFFKSNKFILISF